MAAFERTNRMLVPSAAVWEDAGHLLRALQASRGAVGAGYPSLVNDVLIALSAHRSAPPSPSNERDFAAICRVRPFKLAISSG